MNIHLGAAQSGKHLYLDADVRTTHMHVLGASGRGKSFFLEHLIRQDIQHGNGLCLIDPHGTLYEKVVAWCSEHPAFSWSKLILLDASAPGWTFGFNPLNFAGADISYCVDSMVNACAQVWGGEDTSATPLLKRALRGIFHALAEQGLTLLEANYLLNEREELRPVRELLTTSIADPIIREQWNRWNEMPIAEFRKDFASSTNRLMEFFAAPVIRLIVGQMHPVIDFRKAMDEGSVILVNLASQGRLSDFNARTLGTLITNDLFLKAQSRPEGSRPFYLYIDECGRYLNESIQRILDESRKRGLHLILANQHLSQLEAAGDTVYSAVMTDAQTKVIFGGLSSVDADIMVREVFLDIDLEEPKKSNGWTAVGQESIILKSGSMGRSRASGTAHARGEGQGRSSGESSGVSEFESTVLLPDGMEGTTTGAWGMSGGTTSSETSSSFESTAESETETVSEMNGWTESLKTVYAEAPGAYHTLEEQRYKKVAWLKKQPRQMALLVRPDFSLIPFRVAQVLEPITTPVLYERLVMRRYKELPFVMEEKAMLDQFETRTRELHRRAGIEHADINLVGDQTFDPYDNG